MLFGPKYELTDHGDTVEAHRICSITKERYSVSVPKEAFLRWRGGEYAQRAFADKTAEEREFLISNTTPAEWNATFAGEE